ncbi:MAG: aminotransferase [Acidimicrobiaceae bacterium]|nr:aminotransferase [Acidimicrobiaceae bacterium]
MTETMFGDDPPAVAQAAPSRFDAYDTEALWRKDLDHYVHPFTDFAHWSDDGALVIAESEGVYVYDSDGRRYLDSQGGLWCVNAGYGRTEIADAMAEQARKLAYYSPFTDTTSAPGANLAHKLASLAPGDLNHVFFGLSGSDANDTAARIIHFYFNRLGQPRKKTMITRVNAYHGSSYMAMSLTGVAHDHLGFDVIGEPLIARVSGPDLYRESGEMTPDEYTAHLVEEFRTRVEGLGPENVAAFFAEPIMGAGGVLVPPPGYLPAMREACRDYGILYVSDEVVTAFGRLGHFFASREVFGVQPDIINSAKGLTSGYAPLSATLLSDEIHEVISVPQAPGAVFSHGYTYSGHPVSCAAALANIELMEREDVCGHVRRVGPYFEQRLRDLADLPLVGDVRGKCFMMCIESVADSGTKEMFPAEVEIGRRISKACDARGLLVRPIGHLNVLSPPLILTVEQIDWLVDALRDGIEEVMSQLEHEGLWRR